jgi:bifunctional NMN adenylyltransferase/nudix hydrolase
MTQASNTAAPDLHELPTIAVIVGRFQTPELHEGHKCMFDIILSRHPKVLVLLGVKPGNATRRDPLDFETRRLMLEAAYGDRLVVKALPDCPDDRVWDARLDQQIRQLAPHAEVRLYGSRDSFIHGYKGMFQTEMIQSDVPGCSATKLREQAFNSVQNSADFRSGILYATGKRYPSVYPTVDIAILNPERTALLLARKPGESQFRLPGGFADPTDADYEAAARREAQEECGDLQLSDMQYVGSCRVDDWRYRRTEDAICTLLFATTCLGGNAEARDDIEALRWFNLAEVTENDLVPEHLPLFKLLKTKYLHS